MDGLERARVTNFLLGVRIRMMEMPPMPGDLVRTHDMKEPSTDQLKGLLRQIDRNEILLSMEMEQLFHFKESAK